MGVSRGGWVRVAPGSMTIRLIAVKGHSPSPLAAQVILGQPHVPQDGLRESQAGMFSSCATCPPSTVCSADVVALQPARYPRQPQSRRFVQKESLKRNWSGVSFSRERQTDALATAPFLASGSRAS